MMRFAFITLVLATSALGQTLFDPAITMSDSPLRRGLVGYWRLEEASGTRYDCSKNGNHLTSNNSVGQGTGKVQKAATFVTTSSQWLSIASNASLTIGSSEWTACGWAMVTNKGADKFVVGKYKTTTNEREWDLTYSSSVIHWALLVSSTGSSPTTLDSGVAPTTNVWYFLSCGRQTGTNWISVNNGTRVTAAAINLFAGGGDFTIGATSTGAVPFDGSIDEVGVWKRALSASELTFLYNAGLGTHFPWAHP